MTDEQTVSNQPRCDCGEWEWDGEWWLWRGANHITRTPETTCEKCGDGLHEDGTVTPHVSPQPEPEPPVGFIAVHDRGQWAHIAVAAIEGYGAHHTDGHTVLATKWGAGKLRPTDESPAEIAAKITAAQLRMGILPSIQGMLFERARANPAAYADRSRPAPDPEA
jgi:hypothetical protein